MNLSQNIPQKNPQLDTGGVGETKAKAILDIESPLGQQQQTFLMQQRERLCQLVANKKMGSNNDSEIRAVFQILAGRMHVGEWDDLNRVFAAIQSLGAGYHRAFVVLGGWHHDGAVDNLDKPNEDLLKLVGKYWNLLCLDFWRRKVLAEKAHTWSDSVDKVIKGLDACHPTLPLSLWRFPNELGGRIDGAKSVLEPQVECALLFLQPRIFIFSPEKGKPESGWKDFYDFVLGYRSLVKTFRSDFTQYYWGIYPSNA